MTYKVLAADDEQELLDVLELYLAKDDIELVKATNGKAALEAFHSQEVHLLLLDIMMPELDGYSVLRQVRSSSNVPAIMISAKNSDNDKILGLELGADDYITKPFNPMEVAARVKAHLRRNYRLTAQVPTDALQVITLFDLVLNKTENSLTKKGVPVGLTSTEYKIISMLMAQPGRVFTKKQIYEEVWQDYYVEDDSALLVHLSNLRSKIEDNPKQPQILKTIKGLGYKLEKEQP